MRRLRREGDPTNLVLWFATVVYLLVVAIPLYFPDVFGIEGRIGVVFAHNAFTVQFLYERLPLYIVALYPAVTMLAFEIVRTLGVFRDRGILVGAVCVGFVHHCFYEVFDQLGPQLLRRHRRHHRRRDTDRQPDLRDFVFGDRGDVRGCRGRP